MTQPTKRKRLVGGYQENSRCRACGYRRAGMYSRFDTLCPSCGTTATWSWQLWRLVIERRRGWFGRWEQRPGDEVFTTDRAVA